MDRRQFIQSLLALPAMGLMTQLEAKEEGKTTVFDFNQIPKGRCRILILGTDKIWELSKAIVSKVQPEAYIRVRVDYSKRTKPDLVREMGRFMSGYHCTTIMERRLSLLDPSVLSDCEIDLSHELAKFDRAAFDLADVVFIVFDMIKHIEYSCVKNRFGPTSKGFAKLHWVKK